MPVKETVSSKVAPDPIIFQQTTDVEIPGSPVILISRPRGPPGGLVPSCDVYMILESCGELVAWGQ